eukprot:scaffold474080_cov63-Attheya_sp.AAC.4
MECFPETEELSLGRNDNSIVDCDCLSLRRTRCPQRPTVQSDESTPSIPDNISDTGMYSRSLINEEEKQSDHDQPTVEGEPGIHDVLLGRGGRIYNHEGNIFFRKLIKDQKVRPPGSFLRARSEENWVKVGDHAARKKTSRCLRQHNKDVQQIMCQKYDEHRRAILSIASNFHQASGYGKFVVAPTDISIVTTAHMHQFQHNAPQQEFLLQCPPIPCVHHSPPGIAYVAPMMSAVQLYTECRAPQRFVFGNRIPHCIVQGDNIQIRSSLSL